MDDSNNLIGRSGKANILSTSENRIDRAFARLQQAGKPAFIPYITAGDPTLEQTKAVVQALEKAGADILELGIPFSDPVGDGPAIQAAAQRALENHVTTEHIFSLVRDIRQKSELPLLLFTYFNPILAYGPERFAKDAAAAGADGVLCVDLPPEEADEYKAALDSAGMATVFLTAPTTTNARLEAISRQCTGFVYYVSRLGVTGEQSELQADLDQAVARIKAHTDKPVAVGFGISKPEHAHAVGNLADGVVVGSALVRLIGKVGDAPELGEAVGALAGALAEATHNSRG